MLVTRWYDVNGYTLFITVQYILGRLHTQKTRYFEFDNIFPRVMTATTHKSVDALIDP